MSAPPNVVLLAYGPWMVLAAGAPAFGGDEADCAARGLVYTRTEIKGGDTIVHCRRAPPALDLDNPAGLRAALRRILGGSTIAARVLTDFDSLDVTIAPGELPSNIRAAFDPNNGRIIVNRTEARAPPLSLALSILHEARHAVQALKERMAPCLEAEQDAYFVQNAAYFELREQFGDALPADDVNQLDFADFARSLDEDGLDAYFLAKNKMYMTERENALIRASRTASGELSPWRMIYNSFYDFDFLKDYEPLAYQGSKVMNIEIRPVIRQSEALAIQQFLARQSWIKEHRSGPR